jgi:pimeloyl-ACP methyl ester carboxylesterase
MWPHEKVAHRRMLFFPPVGRVLVFKPARYPACNPRSEVRWPAISVRDLAERNAYACQRPWSARRACTRSHPRLQCLTPTLILWGEDDRTIPVEAAYAFHAAIAGSKLVVYPNTGHVPQEEVADESAADVRAFLSGAEITLGR